MAGGFTLKLEGLEAIRAKLDVKKFEQGINTTLAGFGLDVVRDAKQQVPIDEGQLARSIGTSAAPLSVEIVVNTDYAAYVEFGTRKYAAQYVSSLPAEWQAFAAQFKGSGGGGTFQELVMRLVRWCKAKGIEEKAAYPIARSILINGTKPQPFLYPAFEKNRITLLRDLKDLF